MGKVEITVTMPVSEYERLKSIERSFLNDIAMFEAANVDGKATMTEKLRLRIEEIYC